MANVSKIIFYLLTTLFFFGQLFRINAFGLNFPVFDIALIIFSIINIIVNRGNINRKIALPFFIFIFINIVSFIYNSIVLHQLPIKALFYLFRLIAFILLLGSPPKISSNQKFYLILVSAASVLFGYLQYFLWPDLTYFDSLNWDPHLYRLVGSFLDPTFTGLIYLFFLIHLYLSWVKNPTIYKLVGTVFVYIALALTYSRSTLLSLFIASIFISLRLKNLKHILTTTIVISLTILFLPRQPGEGTKLERTSSIRAKIENYSIAIKTIASSPVIGFGYNFLPIIRNDIKPNSHASGGFDSSLLTIFATSGILGIGSFLIGFKRYLNNCKTPKKALLIALLVHSLFANSLLYPWIVFLVAVL